MRGVHHPAQLLTLSASHKAHLFIKARHVGATAHLWFALCFNNPCIKNTQASLPKLENSRTFGEVTIDPQLVAPII